MFTAIKLFFGRYLNWIIGIAIASLLASTMSLGYLYRKALERNGQLEYSLQIQTAAVQDLTQRLRGERTASERLQRSYNTVNQRYGKLKKQLEEIPRDPITNDIDDESVRLILCQAGLGDDILCKK